MNRPLFIFLLIACTYLSSPGLARFAGPSERSLSKPGSAPVVLLLGGDCLLAAPNAKATADVVSHIFKDFDLLKSADVAVVNLEGPMTSRGLPASKPYTFRMLPEFVGALASAGVKVVNLANNHVFDYGEIGLCDTFSYLDSIGVHYCGAGRNATQAHTPALFRVKGRAIAVFGYYWGKEAPPATDTSAGVARRSVDGIRRDIKRVRDSDASAYVVVNLHWGHEMQETPDSEQVAFAHKVVQAGANLVVGHHPHVLQGIERYESGVIAYSLGNFVFGGRNLKTYNTVVLEVRLTGKNQNYNLIPLRVRPWHVRQLGRVQADSVIAHVRALSRSFPESIFVR